MASKTRTMPSLFKNTLLLSLLILSTSWSFLDRSRRSAIVSPGTMFQYFILSLGRTDLTFCSWNVSRIRQCRGNDRRCLKSLVKGELVVALRTWALVKCITIRWKAAERSSWTLRLLDHVAMEVLHFVFDHLQGLLFIHYSYCLAGYYPYS